MEIDRLTKSQIVWLCLLITVVTSVVTAITTVTLVRQAPPPLSQTINRVIEKTIGVVPEISAPPASNAGGEPAEPLSREEAIVKVVKDVSPAVVSVLASKDLPVIEQYFVDPFGGDDFLKNLFPDIRIPQYRQKGTERQQVSSGSGFFVSADGLLLTNKHVVADREAEYTIIVNDGKSYKVKVLARDPLQDLAILKVEDAKAPATYSYIPFGDSGAVNIGQTVIAVGNALGEFRNTVSVGIVSGLDRNIVAEGSFGTEDLQGLVQTDAAINPGNSGGPLIDLRGRVVGVNTAVAQGGENIGFALPINTAKRAVLDVKEFGRIRYPYLGIRYLVTEKGLLVAAGEAGEPAVELASPASKAGLREGDVIFMTARELSEILVTREPGEEVILKVLRNNVTISVAITLGERPAE